MHQPRQTALIFPCPCDQMCCSILNMLQLVHDLLRHGVQNAVMIVDTRCDKGVDQCLYRLNVQWVTNRSQLLKPEEACFADIWNMPVKNKVHYNIVVADVADDYDINCYHLHFVIQCTKIRLLPQQRIQNHVFWWDMPCSNFIKISLTWLIGVKKPTAYTGCFHALNDCGINKLFPCLQMQSHITCNDSNYTRNKRKALKYHAPVQLRLWICQAIRRDFSVGQEQFSQENTTNHTIHTSFMWNWIQITQVSKQHTGHSTTKHTLKYNKLHPIGAQTMHNANNSSSQVNCCHFQKHQFLISSFGKYPPLKSTKTSLKVKGQGAMSQKSTHFYGPPWHTPVLQGHGMSVY